MQLITGGTGIVGIHLLHLLTSCGHSVRALVRPGSDRRIVERVFRHYSTDPNELLARITWVEGDLHDMSSLEDAMVGVERVYHAAALVSFDPRELRELRRTNIEGTANVVNAALNAGVRRLCHVSSTASMGRAVAGVPVDESLPWVEDRTTSPYALSKYESELEVQRGIAEGLDAVIANPSVVIGPGSPGRSSMTLAERLHRGTRFHPTGSNGFVDARDVAQALVLLMEQGATGERHLIVGGNHSYAELFGMHATAFGRSAIVTTTVALGPGLGLAVRTVAYRHHASATHDHPAYRAQFHGPAGLRRRSDQGPGDAFPSGAGGGGQCGPLPQGCGSTAVGDRSLRLVSSVMTSS
jgi:dihydroflavonol-4-reductase